jgi:3-hydroxybutyryl-CoA dehydrogenase
MASATKRPDKVIGLHFFNPPYAMKLVEIVLGDQTSEETRKIAEGFAQALGKETVTVKDSPGFIVNRIVLPMLNEAVYMVYEGKTSMEDVDKAVTLGMNFPVGPFRLADFVGLDIALAVLENLHKVFGEKFKPCPLLVEKVKAGHLGLKTRKGFYEY